VISTPVSDDNMKLTQCELVDRLSGAFRVPEVGYQFFLSPKAQGNQ